MRRLVLARSAGVMVLALALCAQVWPQNVSMSGSFGDKALLVIDGSPRTVATGTTVAGVKLVSVSGGEAVVEVKGKRVSLLMGGAQVNLGAAGSGAGSEGGGSQIVISAGSGGHFLTGGTINGKAVRFLVDTGATNVSLSEAEARRLGVDYLGGRVGMSNTANGQVAVHMARLASVRIGDVQVYDVEATIVPMPMEQVLLGNSFLSRFQMRRENDVLTLSKRY